MRRFFNILKLKTILTILLVLTVAISIFLTIEIGRIGDRQSRDFFITQAKLVATAVDPNDVLQFNGNNSELSRLHISER